MNNAELKDKMLLEMYHNQSTMTVTLARIEADVKEHVRRSTQQEVRVTTLERVMWMQLGAWVFAGSAFSIWKIWLS